GDRAVAIALRRQLRAVVRVVRRLVHHREHFAGIRVEHDGRAGARARVRDHRLELAVREVLEAQIDARAQVAAGAGYLYQLVLADYVSESIFQHSLAAVLSPEPLIVFGLEPFLAAIVDVGESKQVADDFALGVITLVFAHRAHARQAERRDLLRLRRR